MKRSKSSEEQIVYALRQAESGILIGVCAGNTDCGTNLLRLEEDVSDMRRLRQLEEENSRLKRPVAAPSLDMHMLSEALPTTG
jgi:putative transposase